MKLEVMCPVCEGSGSNSTCEGSQVCHGCDGKTWVAWRKFINLLRVHAAPDEVIGIVERSLEKLAQFAEMEGKVDAT